MTDELLAERTRQGNGSAFAALVDRHGDAVYRIVANLCPAPGEAEEAVHQTFLSAWRDAASRPRDASFRAWLYRIAVKESAGRQQGFPGPGIPSEVFLPCFGADGDLEPSTGEWPDPGSPRLEEIELTGLLRRALGGMDESARVAFVLCDLAQLPIGEAAPILDAAPETVRQRVHRARLMLRGFLDRLWST
jgi:RNA polymerase sigma-70 factor, ECF subfamily